MPSPINRIVLGDCFDILNDVPDGSIDLVVADPPYGAGMDFANDKLPDPEFLSFTDRWVHLVVTKLKDAGSLYCFIDKRMIGKFQSILDKYLLFRNIVVWTFEAFFNGFHGNYDNRCEFVLFYTRSGDYTFNMMKEPPSASLIKRWGPYADENGDIPYEALTPSMRVRQSKENYDRNPTNIHRGAYQGNVIHLKRVRYRDHPAEKPEELVEKLVRISSNERDVVLDPFAGSGTTCVAAKKTRRRYIGIEIDPEYHAVATNRVDSIVVSKRIEDF